MVMILVVMGVSGSGKTTIGQALAKQLGCPFYDADDFHPPENITKMASGIPLDDTDRQPWLAGLSALIQHHLAQAQNAVIACSALKKQYRDQLRQENDRVHFIYLDGEFDLIWSRMQARSGHYMQAAMLQSQFADLEPPEPDEALIVPIDKPVVEIIYEILLAIQNEWLN